MTVETRPCSRCGGTMHFRLGEYECDGCSARVKPGGVLTPPPSEPAPPQLAAQREDSASAQTAYAMPQAQLGRLRSTQDVRLRNVAPEKYDPAPGIEREKMILFAIYSGRVLITIAAAALSGKGFDEPAWMIKDGIGFLLIVLALFTPVIVFKWIAAYLSAIVGGLSLLGLFFSMILIMFLHGNGSGGFYGFLGAAGGMFLALAAAIIELWLASVLFRDMHRVEVMRG